MQISQDDGAGTAGAPALEEQAYQHLRRALVEGVFAPGDRLSLRRVAAALGTSPMPVRTALRRLATEQALEIGPSGTATVPRLTRAAFAELGAIRAELEPLAVVLAAPRLTAADLDLLEALSRDHTQAKALGDPAAVLRADREFLFGIYRMAAAPMLLGFIEALWLRRGPVFWDARWILTARPGVGHRHTEMVTALREGRGAEAADALRGEIVAATGHLLERLVFAEAGAPAGGLAALGTLRRTAGRLADASLKGDG